MSRLLADIGLRIKDNGLKKVILIVALALVSTGAWGYKVFGEGADYCAEYLAKKQENSVAHYKQIGWVQGFISGGNVERGRNGGNGSIGEGLDPNSLALWIENYCLANPLNDLSDAADALVKELKAKE